MLQWPIKRIAIMNMGPGYRIMAIDRVYRIEGKRLIKHTSTIQDHLIDSSKT